VVTLCLLPIPSARAAFGIALKSLRGSCDIRPIVGKFLLERLSFFEGFLVFSRQDGNSCLSVEISLRVV